jgi:hypothetical protein
MERDPSSSKYVHITPDQVMMGSLRNKNKKKGFKQSMTGPIPRKIVFLDGVEQEQPHESNSALDGHVPQKSADPQALETSRSSHRFIPPSELQDLGRLPSNVFVTSMDVEEHIWGSSNGLPKKTRGKKRKPIYVYDDGGEDGFEDGREQVNDQADIEELPYGDGNQADVTTLVTPNDIDWDKAEKLWNASSLIQDLQHLTEGAVFGWKVAYSY